MWEFNLNPIIFSWQFIELRYYGILFVTGVILAWLVAYKLFRRHHLPINDLWDLSLYLLLGTLIGARLGHVLFYNFDYFSQRPTEILYFTRGGLSSHGATMGLLAAYYLFIKIKRVPFSRYADIICVGLPLAAACVRLGNWFNSEIVGRPTALPWGVKFPYFELNPVFRHPSQIYEALIAFAIFLLLWWFYKTLQPRWPTYSTLLVFILTYFSSRFLVELVKDFPILSPYLPLTMGQVLSLPFIILALIGLFYLRYKENVQTTK